LVVCVAGCGTDRFFIHLSTLVAVNDSWHRACLTASNGDAIGVKLCNDTWAFYADAFRKIEADK